MEKRENRYFALIEKVFFDRYVPRKDGVEMFERFVGKRVLATERDYFRFLKKSCIIEESSPWSDEPSRD